MKIKWRHDDDDQQERDREIRLTWQYLIVAFLIWNN